jgi:hypothetical protein
MAVIISSHKTNVAMMNSIHSLLSENHPCTLFMASLLPATMLHPTEDIITKQRYFATECIADCKERAPMQIKTGSREAVCRPSHSGAEWEELATVTLTACELWQRLVALLFTTCPMPARAT